MENIDFVDLLEMDQHDPEVQYQLGLRYLNGEGTERDSEQAAQWFHRAAEQGHEQAAQRINGAETTAPSETINEENLPAWCLMAEEGSENAQFAVAEYFMKTDPAGARHDISRYLAAAAEQGHGMACLLLGKQYLEDGNDMVAVSYLKKACECSIPEAAHLLSDCYFRGCGTEQDPGKAEELLVRAAEWDNSEALVSLAARFATGHGVTVSRAKALSYLAKAQRSGVADAREKYDALVAQFSREDACDAADPDLPDDACGESDQENDIEENENTEDTDSLWWRRKLAEDEAIAERQKAEWAQYQRRQQEAEAERLRKKREAEAEIRRRQQEAEAEVQRRRQEARAELLQSCAQIAARIAAAQPRLEAMMAAEEKLREETARAARVLETARLRNRLLKLPVWLMGIIGAVITFFVAGFSGATELQIILLPLLILAAGLGLEVALRRLRAKALVDVTGLERRVDEANKLATKLQESIAACHSALSNDRADLNSMEEALK